MRREEFIGEEDRLEERFPEYALWNALANDIIPRMNKNLRSMELHDKMLAKSFSYKEDRPRRERRPPVDHFSKPALSESHSEESSSSDSEEEAQSSSNDSASSEKHPDISNESESLKENHRATRGRRRKLESQESSDSDSELVIRRSKRLRKASADESPIRTRNSRRHVSYREAQSSSEAEESEQAQDALRLHSGPRTRTQERLIAKLSSS